MTWLDQTHPDFKANQIETVRAHLHGTIVDNLDRHLVQKRQGESNEEFRARKEIASYVPHFQRAALALAGMIIQNESDAEREWFPPPLGGPSQSDTVIGRLWENVDGQGTDWPVLRTQALVDMVGFQKLWTVVEGVRFDGERTRAGAVDDGSIQTVGPGSVLDWIRDSTGRLVQVKVKRKVDRRTGLKEDAEETEVFFVYDLEGVERWIKRDGEPQRIDRHPYGPDGFQFLGRDGRPVLPIYETTVPVRAPIGFMMARFAEWLFNFRNVRNFHLWSSALARSWVDAVDENGRFDEELWETFNDLLQEGANHFPKELGYSAPPMDGASVRNETLSSEVDDFYSVFFQSFGDVATERTATEIRQDIAQSVGAYLTLQTEALDEWENDALWRIAQVNAPDAGPDLWSQGHVKRNTDFAELNVVSKIQDLREGAFEEEVPLGPTGRKNAARKFADFHDIEIDDEEIDDEVRSAQEDLLRRIREQNGQNAQLQL